MPNRINLTGTSGETYNLDEMSSSNTRVDSSSELIVQIWKWNPNLPSTNPHHLPQPENLQLGQIWLSQLVEVGSEDYTELLGE